MSVHECKNNTTFSIIFEAQTHGLNNKSWRCRNLSSTVTRYTATN